MKGALLVAALLVAGAAGPALAEPTGDAGTVLAWSDTTLDGLSTLTLALADGSSPHRVDDRLTVLGRPAVGPHGQGIAVSVPNGHETGLYGLDLVQPDGARRTLTRPLREADEDPAWSPDGRKLAAVRVAGYPGSKTARLIVFSPFGKISVVPFVKGDVHDPTWSPDGTTLAYTDEHGLETVKPGGHPVLQMKGKGLRQPAWFPDGRSFAVLAPGPGNTMKLDRVYAKHGHPLGRFVGSVDSPIWDADGTGLLALTYSGSGDSGRTTVSLVHVGITGVVTRIRGLPRTAHDLGRGSTLAAPQ